MRWLLGTNLQQAAMYLEFFGLRELPFTLTPNIDFCIELDDHHHAYTQIKTALAGGSALVAVTGEVGTGKSLICRCLMNSLNSSWLTAYIPNPFLTPDGLLLVLAGQLDIAITADRGRQALLDEITVALANLKRDGRNAVLLLDEAQAMPDDSIDILRLLANLEADSAKLLQIVMLGQPELNDLLNRDALRQLKQRITLAVELRSLSRTELAVYIHQRLAKAGFPGSTLFSNKAMDDVFKASGGNPRLINILCHKAMLVAYGRGDTGVNHLHVARAVDDTVDARSDRKRDLGYSGGFRWPAMVAACACASGVTMLATWWLL